MHVLDAHVDEIDLVTVGGIRIAYLEHFRILLCLRHTDSRVRLVGLGFNDREFYSVVFEDIIYLLRVPRLDALNTSRSDEVCPLLVEDDAFGEVLLFPSGRI